MLKTGRQKKPITISTKLALVMALSLLAALSLLMGYMARGMINSMKVGQASKEKTVVEMRLSELENYYATLKSYSISIRNDEKFMKLISVPDSTFEGEEYVKTLLRNIYYSRNDIRSFKVYLLDEGKNYTFEAGNTDVKEKKNPPETQIPGYTESLLNDGFLHISPSMLNDCLFTVTRTIIDIKTKKPLAVVVLEVDDSFFKAIARDNTRILALLDSSNRLYYSTDTSVINATNMIYLSPYLVDQASAAGSAAQIKKDYYLLAYDTSKETGWRLVSLEPENIIFQAVFKNSIRFIWVALSLTILGALLFFLYIRRLAKPLYALSDAMGSLAEGKPAVLQNIKSGVEGELLNKRFLALADRIETLQNQNSDILQQEQALRLEALEATFNPYFLCHVLQSIQLTAMRNGQDEIQTMTQTLYAMADYAMNAEECMSVAKEVEYVKEYLFLERVQVNDRLDYRITADKQVNSLKVPKILLQPMVESSIMRSLENHRDSLFIDIRIALNGNVLTVTVQDDAGATAAQAEEIKRQTGQLQHTAEQGITGTSLANLAARIGLMYGGSASFSLSQEGEDTVCLTLGIQQGEEQ